MSLFKEDIPMINFELTLWGRRVMRASPPMKHRKDVPNAAAKTIRYLYDERVNLAE